MIAFMLRVFFVTVALALATMAGGGAVMLLFGDIGIPEPEGAVLPWQLGSWIVVAVTLVWLAHRSHLRGWRLAAGLAMLLFGIAHFNSIIEARFFGLISSQQLAAILAMTAFADALFALALLPLVRRLPAPSGPERGWIPQVSAARLTAGALAYLVVYFAAGLAIMPFIEDFYAQLTLPSGLEVVAMQLLIRGPVFVALAVLLVRMSGAERGETVLMTGAALLLLGGVATLMVPNAFVPDATRWAHFVEVGISNFVYGCFLGWLLTSSRAKAAASVRVPVTAP